MMPTLQQSKFSSMEEKGMIRIAECTCNNDNLTCWVAISRGIAGILWMKVPCHPLWVPISTLQTCKSMILLVLYLFKNTLQMTLPLFPLFHGSFPGLSEFGYPWSTWSLEALCPKKFVRNCLPRTTLITPLTHSLPKTFLWVKYAILIQLHLKGGLAWMRMTIRGMACRTSKFDDFKGEKMLTIGVSTRMGKGAGRVVEEGGRSWERWMIWRYCSEFGRGVFGIWYTGRKGVFLILCDDWHFFILDGSNLVSIGITCSSHSSLASKIGNEFSRITNLINKENFKVGQGTPTDNWIYFGQ